MPGPTGDEIGALLAGLDGGSCVGSVDLRFGCAWQKCKNADIRRFSSDIVLASGCWCWRSQRLRFRPSETS
eukprot:1792530-Rhodomonas_salina.4